MCVPRCLDLDRALSGQPFDFLAAVPTAHFLHQRRTLNQITSAARHGRHLRPPQHQTATKLEFIQATGASASKQQCRSGHCKVCCTCLSASGIWSLRLETHSWAHWKACFRIAFISSRLPGLSTLMAPNKQSTAVSALPDDAVNDHHLIRMTTRGINTDHILGGADIDLPSATPPRSNLSLSRPLPSPHVKNSEPPCSCAQPFPLPFPALGRGACQWWSLALAVTILLRVSAIRCSQTTPQLPASHQGRDHIAGI